jgi:hypothetical protein
MSARTAGSYRIVPCRSRTLLRSSYMPPSLHEILLSAAQRADQRAGQAQLHGHDQEAAFFAGQPKVYVRQPTSQPRPSSARRVRTSAARYTFQNVADPPEGSSVDEDLTALASGAVHNTGIKPGRLAASADYSDEVAAPPWNSQAPRQPAGRPLRGAPTCRWSAASTVSPGWLWGLGDSGRGLTGQGSAR